MSDPMIQLMSSIPAAIPLLLLAAGLTPTIWANRHVSVMRTAVVLLTSITFCMSVVTALMFAYWGRLDGVFFQIERPIPMSVGVYVDGIAVVMLILISFIGTVISRYSVRYLDGELTQGRFLKWMSFTLGSVLLLVVARNLVMFTAAWMLASFGLHQLLTHYPERSWAIWAARKKFLVSRLGDAMLFVALGLTFWSFGSSEYSVIFAAANEMRANSADVNLLVSTIAVLYVVGAMTKSAQFPFHSWLPDTMETPTPVSALMHAGIINAGGFLVIRLSPLISLSHVALDFLALIGAFTALFGSVVMLTQTSIKRSLAYSTIAQMGFMMLQCGLGAFSAALLHIVAHSLYKAHAFLSCGSVLESAARMRSDSCPTRSPILGLVWLPVAIAIAVGVCEGSSWILGIDHSTKPGATVLGLLLSISITQLVWNGLTSGSWQLAMQSILAAGLVCIGYFVAFLTTDYIIADSVSHRAITPSILDYVILGLVAVGFVGVFALQAVMGSLSHRPWVRSLYVHAMNGFYLDIPARRVTAFFWGQAAPVQ